MLQCKVKIYRVSSCSIVHNGRYDNEYIAKVITLYIREAPTFNLKYYSVRTHKAPLYHRVIYVINDENTPDIPKLIYPGIVLHSTKTKSVCLHPDIEDSQSQYSRFCLNSSNPKITLWTGLFFDLDEPNVIFGANELTPV